MSCLLLLVKLTLFYDCLWPGDKGSWHRNISSAYHPWPDFWHYTHCFTQSGEAFTVKGKKHTYSRTYTHTHARIHTHTHSLTQQTHVLLHNTLRNTLSVYFPLGLTEPTSANISLFKFNNRNTRKRFEIYSKLHDVIDIVLVSVLLTLNIFYNFLQTFLLFNLNS